MSYFRGIRTIFLTVCKLFFEQCQKAARLKLSMGQNIDDISGEKKNK